MKVAVFDTYVTKKDSAIMHFDILVPQDTPQDQVLAFGREYLVSKKQPGQPLTAQECRFCHTEHANARIEQEIQARGYFIIEFEGC
jgi:hypothetical protein